MKYVIVGFSSPKKFKIGAWLIKKWIKKSYSHVYIRYNNEDNMDVVFHAAHGTVHHVSYDRFASQNETISSYILKLTDEEFKALQWYCYGTMGLTYDTGDLIKIVLYDIAEKVGIRLNTKDWSGYICSELASEVLNILKDFKFHRPFNLIEPHHVEAELLRNLQCNPNLFYNR